MTTVGHGGSFLWYTNNNNNNGNILRGGGGAAESFIQTTWAWRARSCSCNTSRHVKPSCGTCSNTDDDDVSGNRERDQRGKCNNSRPEAPRHDDEATAAAGAIHSRFHFCALGSRHIDLINPLRERTLFLPLLRFCVPQPQVSQT